MSMRPVTPSELLDEACKMQGWTQRIETNEAGVFPTFKGITFSDGFKTVFYKNDGTLFHSLEGILDLVALVNNDFKNQWRKGNFKK